MSIESKIENLKSQMTRLKREAEKDPKKAAGLGEMIEDIQECIANLEETKRLRESEAA